LEEGKEPGKDGPVETTQNALSLAFDNFARGIRENAALVSGPLEGYQATVIAIKANEAIITGNKVTFDKSWFELK
jgi:hypothetical protein